MVCDVDLGQPDATRTHTIEVAREFAREGLAVDLLTRGPDPRIDGVRFTRARGDEHDRIRRIPSMNAQMARLLWRRRRGARRLYVRHNWTLLLGMLLGRALGYRLVTQVDDIPYGRGYELEISPLADYVKRFAAAVMGRLAHGVVAVTPEIKGLLVEQFGVRAERVEVLPNGVDVDFFHRLPREDALDRLGLDRDRRHIVFCGQFAAWVDFDTILDGFAIARAKCADARLILVGDGPERDWIARRAAELGLGDAVILTGFVADRLRVRDYMAAAVVAVSANRPDHRARIGVSPVKLAEYLACGRAVVATDLPGLRDVLTATRAGIVVPVDPGAMGAAMVELLDVERADGFGANGRRIAEERFSWRLIVRRTLPLFGL
jgi:glycosyltransferase involved in cell wall biosynthesis